MHALTSTERSCGSQPVAFGRSTRGAAPLDFMLPYDDRHRPMPTALADGVGPVGSTGMEGMFRRSLCAALCRSRKSSNGRQTRSSTTRATSAPGLGSPRQNQHRGLGSPRPHLHRDCAPFPRLHRDWAHRCHSCTGTLAARFAPHRRPRLADCCGPARRAPSCVAVCGIAPNPACVL